MLLALYTTAPGTVTIPVGGLPTTYTIGGGTAPYTATSSNTSVVITSISGGTALNVTGMAAGTANVEVRDAAGKTITITVEVQGGSIAELFTTSPPAITIAAIGGSQIFTIGGGTAPYSVTSSNTNVATASVAGTMLTILGMADGVANIQVIDAASKSLTIAVNVATGTGFSVVTSSAITWTITGCPATTPYSLYFINGGVPPYTVSSDNPLIAAVLAAPPSGAQAVQPAGTTVSVPKGGYFVAAWINSPCLAHGKATFKVIDTAGNVLTPAPTFDVTYTAVPLSVTPTTVTVAVGADTAVSAGGGFAPYTVLSSNTAIATVSIAGTTIIIKGIASGATVVTVTDSNSPTAATAAISVTVP